MKLVRDLGFKKIYSIHKISTEIEGLSEYSAFSVIKHYKDFQCNSWFYGLKYFIDFCEPLLTDVSKNTQRKFRNKWDSLWKAYGDANSLSEAEVMFLSNYGLSLCFKNKVDASVAKFFNDVLCWFVLFQSESYLESCGYSLYSILNNLVVNKDLSFLRKDGVIKLR